MEEKHTIENVEINADADSIIRRTQFVPDKIAGVVFFTVAALFFLSGLSSLIYQVIWTRLLVFVFGATTFASSTVLAVFMGGLAVGSLIAGRYADKIKNPFLWYGILEGIIAGWAVLTPYLLDAAIPLYKVMWQSFHLSILPFSLLRFAVVALILLPPTACMGATLPLLSRFVTTSLSVVGERVGTLYAINTLGAVVGSMLAGFILLPALGLQFTTFIAAGINFLLLLGVLSLCRIWKEKANVAVSAVVAEASPSAVAELGEKMSLPVIVTIIGFGISGAVAMIYEVGWTRSLLMVIGSTTYAFSVMLSTFLIGIFVGSFVMAKFIDRVKDPVTVFAVIEIVLCGVGLISLNLFSYLPYWNLVVNHKFTTDPSMAMVIRFLFAGMIMAPIALCLGAIFPVVVRACTRELSKVGQTIGSLYAVNTFGAIIGAFAAGFVIIPLIGAEQGLILSSVINLVLGVVMLVLFCPLRKMLKTVSVLACMVVVVWSVNDSHVWDTLSILSAQKERRNLPIQQLPSDYAAWVKLLHEQSEVAYWKEGPCATVGVLEFRGGGRALLTSGHVDASDQGDMATQSLLAVYPLLVRPGAKDVAVIGWGCGVTLGYSLLFPVKKLVAIEIEPSVVEASELFRHCNLKPQDDKRLSLELNDGRNYLMATNQLFDVIISEPSNPWQAGVCNLFTKDYFKTCGDRLNKHGIFTLWFQMNEVSTENMRRVLAGLKTVFSHVVILGTRHADSTILASHEPIVFKYHDLQAGFKSVGLAKAMSGLDIAEPEDVLARILCSDDAVSDFTRGVQPNSDNNNRLEFEVAKTYENRLFSSRNLAFLTAHAGRPWENVDWGTKDPVQVSSLMARVAARAVVLNSQRGILWANASNAVLRNSEAYRILSIGLVNLGRRREAEIALEEALRIEPNNIAVMQNQGLVAMRYGDMVVARDTFQKILSLASKNELAKYRLAQTYSPVLTEDRNEQDFVSKVTGIQASPAKVVVLTETAVQDKGFINRHPGILYLRAWALGQMNDTKTATTLMENYLTRNKYNPYGWRYLGALCELQDMTEKAAICFSKAVTISNANCERLLGEAKLLRQSKKYAEALVIYQRCVEMSPLYGPFRQALGDFAAQYEPAAALCKKLSIPIPKPDQKAGV